MLDVTRNSSVVSANANNTQKQANQPVENASAKNGFSLRTIPSDSGSVLMNIAKSRRLSPTEKTGLIRQLATFDTVKAAETTRKNVLSSVQQVASYMEQTSKVSFKPTPVDQAVKQFERAQKVAEQQPPQNRTVERVQQNIESVIQQSRNVSVQEAVQAQPRDGVNVRDNVDIQVSQQREAPQAPAQASRPVEPQASVEVSLPGQSSSEATLALPGEGAGEEIPLPGQADIESLEFALPGDGETAEIALPGQGGGEDASVQQVAGSLAQEDLVPEDVPLEAAEVDVILPGGDDASEASESSIEVAHVQTYV
ncbi:MAG: hypothetical protein OSB62_00510 [Alphaproteobacteria bacterium]|nr:hypothetical protein [Alphaproteobacteria bacterium]